MKAHLLHRDRDFELERSFPPHEPVLMQDMELETLLGAMAGGDGFLRQVAHQALISGLHNDLETILYRQAVLRDCLQNPAVVQDLYALAVETLENRKNFWLGFFTTYPSGILHNAVELLQMLVPRLVKLRGVAETRSAAFVSEGFRAFFALVQAELADDYLARVRAHIKALHLAQGVLLGAELGAGNQGVNYVLRPPPSDQPGWFRRLFTRRPPGYTFYIAERDDAGFRALSELNDRGINQVANALSQSADHILGFFVMLRTELAFYLGAMNLHRELTLRRVPMCFPVPAPAGADRLAATGLRDAGLALRLAQAVEGNDLPANGKNLIVITGANQGGKSTFLRAVGVAQMMMQCGLFVAAESFASDVCRGLFTHYKREEDATMQSGKFDEELVRMSGIADALAPGALVLFNESFAATNEREGSEVARQIVRALREARVKIVFVTHQYAFARGLLAEKRGDTLFLRAERASDGKRTFKLHPGEPLSTSYGSDLYREIFGADPVPPPTGDCPSPPFHAASDST